MIKEGIIKSIHDIPGLQELAKEILPHCCTDGRCLKRVRTGNGKENFVFRKIDKCKLSPDCTKNVWIDLPKECHPHRVARRTAASGDGEGMGQ